MEPHLDRCGYFNQWNQGKKSLQLNLSKPEAIEIAKKLVMLSDVVIDNFATGVMDGFGLGHEDLFKIKPDLVVASVTGYGHTGPQRNYMGYGPAIVMVSGLGSLTGYQGGPPQEVGISLGDPNGGIHERHLAFGELAVHGGAGYLDDLSDNQCFSG